MARHYSITVPATYTWADSVQGFYRITLVKNPDGSFQAIGDRSDLRAWLNEAITDGDKEETQEIMLSAERQ